MTSPLTSRHHTRWPLAVLVALLALVGSACSDDDSSTDTGDTSTTAVSADPDTSATTDSDGDDAGDGNVAVVELDVTAGTEDRPAQAVATLECYEDQATGYGYLEEDPETPCVTVMQAAALEVLLAKVDPNLACTEIYGGPQVAVVTGTIDGKEVDATITRSDGCGIAAWDALLPLLPDPETLS